MTETERILEQGKALVRAIEALETIEATGPIERVITWFLLKAYRCWLRPIVPSAPEWVSEEILSASERTRDDRTSVWLSENRAEVIPCSEEEMQSRRPSKLYWAS